MIIMTIIIIKIRFFKTRLITIEIINYIIMKKLILLLILFINYQSNAQCEISFEEILRNSILNSSDFDTFALNHNYFLDTESKTYFCVDNLELPGILRRFLEESTLNINYSTYSKTSYLELKSGIKKMGFKYDATQNTENMVMYEYSLNNIWIRLGIKIEGYNTNYMMLVKITKPDK